MEAMITGVGWVNSAGRGRGRDSKFQRGGMDGPIDLSHKGILDKPLSRYGRMDDYSRLGLLSIILAMKDAQLDQWTERRNMAITASTVYGCLQTDADYYDTVRSEGGRLASPNIFAYTLSNTFLGEAAIYLGLTGAAFIIHEDSLSGSSGLLLAMNSLARMECQAVITGICDLAPDPALGLTGRTIPGGLFFVLQPAETVPDFSYGLLTREKKGGIFFRGKEVKNLADLAEWCTLK